MSNVQQGVPGVGGSFATRETPHLTVAARGLIALAVLGVSLACSEQQASPLSLSAPSATSADFNRAEKAITPAMLAWQKQARGLVGANSLNPLAAARVYAALAVAQYDAINEADRKNPDGQSPSEGFGPGGRSRVELERGAVAGASSGVLTYFFPAAVGAIDEHRRADAAWSGANTHPQFERGLAVGSQVATERIVHVAADHFTDPWTGSVPTDPDKWHNNGPPVTPQLGKMTPYFLVTQGQFRPAPPPAFGSPAFATALDEIKTLSATRTAEQLASARFWNFGGGTPTPPGYWNDVAGGLVESYQLNERDAAHVFALMHSAMMDALIACWEAKYFYWVVRPSQADPGITLPLGLPNHPSYPSGHSCVSSAATNILSRFFPSEAAQLKSQLTQAGLSRMYAGIHYRFDISSGEVLGNSVANWAASIDARSGLVSVIH